MQAISANKTAFFLKQKTVYIIYFLTINAMNIASVVSGRMNVWKIFRYSFSHLRQHTDLYAAYPQEHFDLYLYSPSFPVMFTPFALLPNYIAYFLWNNMSMLLMPFVIFKLKGISVQKKCLICYIALLDMLTCLQGTQTNVMICVLMVLAFLSFENKNSWIAAFAIAAGFYIKIYPVLAASLFLLYPDKIKFIFRFIVAMIILGALPLLFIRPPELVGLYHNWINELVLDQKDNMGKISLTGLMQSYFNISDFSKLIVQILGVLVFCLMYIRQQLFKQYYYRLYFLCALLIWVTVFNHASEIYGYAIAIWGVGIWYTHQKSSRAMNVFICLFVFFATVLSIDPTPHIILDYIYAHGLKSLPFFLIFCVIVWQMLSKPAGFFSHSLAENER